MRTILTVNAGSSSVRLAAYFEHPSGLEKTASLHDTPSDPGGLLRTFLDENGIPGINVIAHRIVHGGEDLTASCIIDQEVESEIRKLFPLAPLHNPAAIEWVSSCREVFGPDVPNVAVFDTAFYAGLPEVARIYALPGDICSKYGIRRYGFHGLAHRAMWERLCTVNPHMKDGRAISLQLGSGCSITAVDSGQAMDTSMGFSPVEGLVMATRSGNVDPRVVTYLQREAGLSVDDFEDLLSRASGLLGVSGISADMRVLLGSDSHNASLAVDLYCYRARQYTGAYMAALGGCDALVFGGGVGENSPVVRKHILSGMQWCGIELDDGANDATMGREGCISASGSRVEVWVLPVDESAILAGEALRVLKESRA